MHTTVTDRPWRILIGGRALAPAATYPVVNPSTGAEIAQAPDCTAQEVDSAVRAAEKAQLPWGQRTPRERGRLLRDLGRHLLEHRDELAMLDTLDSGAPLAVMKADVEAAVELIEIFADYAVALGGSTLPVSRNLHFTTNEPFGVVARIGAFNHPFFFAASKVAAPLIAGNSVVLKAPDQTPLSSLRFAELCADVLGPDLVITVSGRGSVSGSALVRHPSIRRIGFIGSPQTGRLIQRDAADSGVKHVSLELGGKNAQIVMPDADLEAAAHAAVAGMNFTSTAGQSCGSTSRLLLHESIAEEVLDRVAQIVAGIVVGDPTDPATTMGSVSSQEQYEKSLRFIEAAVSEGGRVVCGGGRPPTAPSEGWFLQPTVVADVGPESTLGQEEVFGPVLAVMTFRDEDDAVRIANNVQFGLTASIWTRDLQTAHRLARAVEAGYVLINSHARHFWGLPFGGTKDSGIGREESLEELMSYTELKVTTVMI
jgi:2-formylbenzoate dehydrogenase